MSSACPDPDSCDSPCNPDREKDVSCGYKGWAAPAACVPTDCPGPFASPVAVAQPVARSDPPQGKEMLPALKRSPQERSIQFFSPSADLANLNPPRFFARLRFLVHDFLDAGSEIFQHHRRGVSAGRSRDRAARKCRRARLVQPRNRHAMLRPPRHRAHRSYLRRALRSRVGASVPEMRIHPFKIEWALHKSRQDLVVGQIRRESSQVFEISFGNLLLDLVPVLRPFLQFVRLPADNF